MSRAAVFIDRDGVINRNWFNTATQAWESPIAPEDFHLFEGVLKALSRLRARSFRLFLVSNQPSAAKGKCSLQDLHAVHAKLVAQLDAAGIAFDDFFYSYTHPDGVVPELSGDFPERKPNPYFLERAIGRWNLDRGRCWMVGDRATDVECGQRAGVRTIKILSTEEKSEESSSSADFYAVDLAAAVMIVLAAAARHS